MTGQEKTNDYIIIGRVSGLYGVRGWVKVYSHTQPRDNIVDYSPWYLRIGGEWQPRQLIQGRAHGKGVVAQLDGCDDRDAAATLMGCDIAIKREQLPAAGPGEFYWSDLVGCRVTTTTGVALGIVDHLLETGSNDVLVIAGERERLVPFTADAVVSVDVVSKSIVVDWDPEF